MDKKIYFASDAHLGSHSIRDPREHEQRIVRWLESIRTTARAVYLMGDMIDFWFEYKHVVPRGFVRFFGKLAEMTDAGIEIHWFSGNHDTWLFDYVQQELGIIVHHRPMVIDLCGKKILLAHGDGLGCDKLESRFLGWFFRNPIAQKLFRWIHPDLGLRFGLAWSAHNRRKESRTTPYLGEDREYLIRYAKEQLGQSAIDYFIFGHRHIALDLMLSRSSRIILLGDWMLNSTYAVFDGKEITLEEFEL